jgi:hypothetical protein
MVKLTEYQQTVNTAFSNHQIFFLFHVSSAIFGSMMFGEEVNGAPTLLLLVSLPMHT